MRIFMAATRNGPQKAHGYIPRGSTKRLAVTLGVWESGPRSWAVTHVPTGCRVIGGITKREASIACRRFARECPVLAQSDDPNSDMSDGQKRFAAALAQQLRVEFAQAREDRNRMARNRRQNATPLQTR